VTALIAAVLVVVVVGAMAGLFGLVLLFDRETGPYPPEAAEVPKDGIEEGSAEPDVAYERARPLTEAGPFVVAGSDLDRAHQPMSLVNLQLRLMVDADPELSGLRSTADALVGLYVAPEVDR
jgi:hypothetical protein